MTTQLMTTDQNATHTPGRWVAKDNLVFALDDRGRGTANILYMTTQDIDGRLTREMPMPECEANARLIAAAPDLLQALQVAKRELAMWVRVNSSEEMAGTDWQEYQQTANMQIINNALAKCWA